MYEEYIKSERTPAGKVLEHILRKAKMTRKQLSIEAGIYPQRISELIKGTRDFTVQQSISIEKALKIGIEGYFYKIQANYEVYAYLTKREQEKHPDLSKFSKALFWDTRIERINWTKNKEWVIQRIFEYGNNQEIEEAIRFYGKETIQAVLQRISSKWKEEARERNFKKFVQ
ncbi:helix-turn-helix transcriptional regulator [Parabacteroides massiliensis]|uniref:helix-turn-helix transcriptional regulator n=1 Tax=Parabacteroides massiliensis TaxID=1750560 RepID=UPI00096A2F58|nr:helix-turn-helix transcriptional regulator [Parabacteroides massiliensis]